MKTNLPRADLAEMYARMLRIRHFEDAAIALNRSGEIYGALHTSHGQEGEIVGTCMALRRDDYMVGNHRSHGHPIGKGAELRGLMAELMGKGTGVCGGKGGSMHLADRNLNFWGGYGIVGGHLPLAAGIALASQYEERDEVVLCLMGDGSTNIGYFHESLNLSAVWNLPVVWLIENNQYGMGTSVERASGVKELVKKARAYGDDGRGMKEGPRIDGMDVLEVHDQIKEAVEYARKNGPILVESLTYRLQGHSMGDPERYRTKEEVEEFVANGPIGRFRKLLIEKYKNIEPKLDEIDARVLEEVEEAVEFAKNSPDPTFEDLVSHVYVD